jgi:superfamily I DNA and/or RNA helicase
VDLNILSYHFSRIVFYDLIYSKESLDDMSKSNLHEAQFTMFLIEAFCYLCSCNFETFKNQIALITPYKGQARRLVSDFDKLRRRL